MGVVKTWNGIARASLKTWDGIASASVKTINGFDATSGSTYVGNDSIGGSSLVVGSSAVVASGRFTAPFSGTITTMDIYCANSNAAQDVKLGLYTNSGSNPASLVTTETEFTNVGTWSAQWKSWSGLSWSVTSGQVYWLAYSFSTTASLTLYYDTASPGYHYDIHTYANSWGTTFVVNGSAGDNLSMRALLVP